MPEEEVKIEEKPIEEGQETKPISPMVEVGMISHCHTGTDTQKIKTSDLEDDLNNQLTGVQKTDLTDGGTTTLHSHTITPTTYLDYRFPDNLKGATLKLLNAQYTVPANKRFYMQMLRIKGADVYTVTVNGITLFNNDLVGSPQGILINPVLVGEGLVVDASTWGDANNDGVRAIGLEISNPDSDITPIYQTVTDSVGYTVPSGKDFILLNVYSNKSRLIISSGATSLYMLQEYSNSKGATNAGVARGLYQPIILPAGTVLNAYDGDEDWANIFGYLKSNS